MISLPERACVVKVGLHGFCCLGMLGSRVKARTFYVVRIGGVLLSLVVVAECLIFLWDRCRLVRVLRFCSRGLCGRSFLCATVPLPVPSWTPAERRAYPRSGVIYPTPMKFIRPSCGTPRRSIIGNTPGRDDQVQGTPRAGVEPQGFARVKRGESTPSQKSLGFLHGVLFMLHFYNLGGGQGNGGNRPERRARARRGMRAGQLVRPCSFLVHGIPL